MALVNLAEAMGSPPGPLGRTPVNTPLGQLPQNVWAQIQSRWRQMQAQRQQMTPAGAQAWMAANRPGAVMPANAASMMAAYQQPDAAAQARAAAAVERGRVAHEAASAQFPVSAAAPAPAPRFLGPPIPAPSAPAAAAPAGGWWQPTVTEGGGNLRPPAGWTPGPTPTGPQLAPAAQTTPLAGMTQMPTAAPAAASPINWAQVGAGLTKPPKPAAGPTALRMHKGGVVPAGGHYILKAGEAVLPAEVHAALRRTLATMGGE